MTMTLPETSIATLAEHLRALQGVRHKLDIRQASAQFGESLARNGDDCAAIPDATGHTLFAIEGLLPEFVEAEPWFAGYCSVMVNVSDIYSMGGRPTAVVDALWSRCGSIADNIWSGMREAAEKYAVPIVGGHTNTRSKSDSLAVAILGRAGKQLLTSFDAEPGDVLIAAIDLRGEWFGKYPYWNCSTSATGERLRGDLEILPQLAEASLCKAAKDISMGGLVGTATMLAECSGVGVTIDVDAIPRPTSVPIEKWLASFPSYGFLLAVPPANADAVLARFAERDIAAAAAGRFDETRCIALRNTAGERAEFWDLSREPFIGFGGE